MSRAHSNQSEASLTLAENSTVPVANDEARLRLLGKFYDVLSRWKESIIHIDNERLHDANWLLQWNDEFLKAGSDGGIDREHLQRLITRAILFDTIDKTVSIRSCKKCNEADTNASPYSEWEYTVVRLKRKKVEKTEGYAFNTLMDVLTDNTLLKKVYKQNGSFIAHDEPELSVLFSEAITTIIDWCRKDNNKNTYINKAAETRKTKIKEFYETLRETVNGIEASNDVTNNKKMTSYKLAAELNKMNVKTYSKSNQWMPNMANKLREYLVSNEPKINPI